MCEVGKRIKKRRISLGMSAEELAAIVGLSPATVYRYENGDIRKVNTTKLTPFANALKTTEAYLMGWVEDAENDSLETIASNHDKIPSNLKPIRPGSGQRVRIVGEIAAGQPIYMDEDYETYVDSPMKADFALVVRGDSMVPTYLDGDIVYIKAQPAVNNGQIAAVAIDESATLKHVYMTKYGLSLMSDNPNYAPIFVKPEDHEIRILGVVVGFTRMYNASNTRIDISKGITIQ